MDSLFAELVDGASKSGGYMLNPGDPGLLASLDRIPASAASARTPSGSSIASHVEHLRYGLSLMIRWSQGENPFASADWTESWKRTTVSDAEWRTLRGQLREEASRWREVLRTPREVNAQELSGMIGSVAHLAYHLGAIRQIDRAVQGPGESGN
jgi:hypothetical protein